MMFVKSGIIRGDSCRSLKDYNQAANRTRISRTENCEMHEQRVYFSRELGAEGGVLNIFVVLRAEDGDKEETWVAGVLSLCPCSVRGNTKGVELAFVRYMDCALPLNAVDETSREVCGGRKRTVKRIRVIWVRL